MCPSHRGPALPSPSAVLPSLLCAYPGLAAGGWVVLGPTGALTPAERTGDRGRGVVMALSFIRRHRDRSKKYPPGANRRARLRTSHYRWPMTRTIANNRELYKAWRFKRLEDILWTDRIYCAVCDADFVVTLPYTGDGRCGVCFKANAQPAPIPCLELQP